MTRTLGCPHLPWRGLAALAVALALVTPGPARGEDTDQTRFYWAFRLGVTRLIDGRPVSALEAERYQQVTGMSAGVNLGPYLGVELAGDVFEIDLAIAGGRKIGEFGMFTLIPQARLRYPLFDGRLTAYLVGGAGLGLAEFNDRKAPASGAPLGPGEPPQPLVRVKVDSPALVGAVGAGIEYFVANNVAVGVESRYVISRGHGISVNGQAEDATLDTLLTAVSLRLLFPESPAVQRAAHGPVSSAGRFYLGLRLGGATTTRERIGSGVEARPENAAILDTLNQVYGATLGWDLTPYLGVEIAGDGWEPILALSGVGSVGEYAIYTIGPQLRLRYPLLDGRLVPYGVAGVGVSYTELNDIKPRGQPLKLENPTEFALMGALGLGIEYFVARNIAVGLEARYHISRGHELRVNGVDRSLSLDAILASLGVRIYFGRGWGVD